MGSMRVRLVAAVATGGSECGCASRCARKPVMSLSWHFCEVLRGRTIVGRIMLSNGSAASQWVSGMKRTRHKRVPSPRRRALEFIAAHPGCTEALLAALNIPADVLVELVQSGLVIARIEQFDDEDGAVEVTCAWVTAAGERVLAARG